MGLVLIIYMIAGIFTGVVAGITSMLWYRMRSKTKIRDWGKAFYLSSFLGFISLASIAIFIWPSRGPNGQDWDGLANAMFILGASPGAGLFVGVIANIIKSK